MNHLTTRNNFNADHYLSRNQDTFSSLQNQDSIVVSNMDKSDNSSSPNIADVNSISPNINTPNISSSPDIDGSKIASSLDTEKNKNPSSLDIPTIQRNMGNVTKKILTDLNLVGDLRPDPLSEFSDIYHQWGIKADLDLLATVKDLRANNDSNLIRNSAIMEESFTMALERNNLDFFREQELLNEESPDNPKTGELVTVPASEIDDNFNHFDLICVIKNKFTDYKPLPFAIDLTYNRDPLKLLKKFNHRHSYGLNEYGLQNKKSGTSDFGYIKYGYNEEGQRLPYAWIATSWYRTKGTKMKGFTSAKYFNDKNDIWGGPYLPKGGIRIMPRFIIGYNVKDAITVAKGLPFKKNDTSNLDPRKAEELETQYQQDRNEYFDAERRILWSTLLEMKHQLQDLSVNVEKSLADKNLDAFKAYPSLTPQEKDHIRLERQVAKSQITKLTAYIEHAVSAFEQDAESDFKLQDAKQRVENNDMYRSILKHSQDAYIREGIQENQK